MQQRTKAQWLFYLISVAVLLTYTFYAYNTESGLYLVLAELQNTYMGQYYPNYTAFLTLFIAGSPIFLIDFLWTKSGSSEHKRTPEERATSDKRGFIIGYTISLFIAVASGFVVYFSSPIAHKFFQPQLLTVLTLNTSSKPKSLFVKLRGEVQYGHIVSFEDGYKKFNFFPITAKNWNVTDTVVIFQKKEMGTNYATDKYKLFKNALPGLVKLHYEKNGFKIGKPYYVAEQVFRATNLEDVSSNIKTGGIIASFMGFILFLVFFFTIKKRYG